MKVAIIADDFTSATDAGVQFARVGYRVQVRLGNSDRHKQRGDVLSIDADSRSCSPGVAQLRTGAAARSVGSASIVYKTIDSTIRGHIGVELAAVLESSNRQTAIVAPAFPAAGRTTRAGVQYLHGLRIDKTGFATDSIHPVRESRLPVLLDNFGLAPVAVLRRWELHNREVMARALSAARAIVADAETEEDLRSIVDSVGDPSRVCWAGSPGLARALADAYPRANCKPFKRGDCRGVLVVAGSLNPVSRRQISRILRRAANRGVRLKIAHKSARSESAAVRRAAAEAGAQLEQGGLAVLFSCEREHKREWCVSPTRGRDVASHLAEVGSRLIASGLVDGLVLTGGDTAGTVLRHIGANDMWLQSELEPGIPVGRVTEPRPLWVVTKAGGFGDDSALVRAYDALSGFRAQRATSRASRTAGASADPRTRTA